MIRLVFPRVNPGAIADIKNWNPKITIQVFVESTGQLINQRTNYSCNEQLFSVPVEDHLSLKERTMYTEEQILCLLCWRVSSDHKIMSEEDVDNVILEPPYIEKIELPPLDPKMFYIQYTGKNGKVKKGQEFVVALDVEFTVRQLKDLIVEQHGFLLGVESKDEFYLKNHKDQIMSPGYTRLSSFGVEAGVTLFFCFRA